MRQVPTPRRPGRDPERLAADLRLEVAALGRLHLHGSRITRSLQVGRPAGPRVSLALPTRPSHSRVPHHDPYADDPALRRDAAARLLEAAVAAGVDRHAWLARDGEVDLHDSDLAWDSALRAAAAEAGLEVATFHVVTRHGWREPATGDEQQWTRLRVRGRHTGAHVERLADALRDAAQSQVCTGSLVCIRSA